MVKKIARSLKFLNLLDKDSNLSISNIAVIIVLVKLAFTPSLSLIDAGTLLVTLMNYAHKRHSGSKQVQQSSEFEQSIKDKLTEFESKLSDNESNVAAAMLKVGLK
jgi:hypothetical protein